jgi:cell division protein FtsB
VRAPRLLGLVLGSVGMAAALFLFVLPGRTYLEQRHSLIAAQTRVRILAAEDARLTQQARRLQTDAEIERLARQQFGLVKPGEKAFAILTPAPHQAATPAPHQAATAAPAHQRAKPGLAGRLWRDIQFWR